MRRDLDAVIRPSLSSAEAATAAAATHDSLPSMSSHLADSLP
jgi:hypothetical protein